MYGPVRARGNILSFRAFDRNFGDVIEHVAYAGINQRRVLAPADREVDTVALLAALRLSGSFEWHIKVALRLGVKDSHLRAAMIEQTPLAGVIAIAQGLRSYVQVHADWLAHPAADAPAVAQ